MAGLKLFHANKIYEGGVHALKDFCLDVEDKEFVVFVGPSGCGKSTALRMIAGLEKITSGDIYIGDRLVNGLPAKDRNISMVFQSYALFPNMSVYDNISFGLRMHGVDKEVIAEKVEDVAHLLSLTDYLKRRPSQLSGGQRQRVALGRAIVRNPDLFLLDEPLSNLDAKLRNKMRSEILALHDRLGATFIYVTHDQTEAMTMGDKIVVMQAGEIMQVGSPKSLYRYPANKFVAGFLGTPQMNFWEGEIEVGDGICVNTGVGRFPLNEEQILRLDEEAKVSGKKVILGIRPEHISTCRKKQSDIELSGKIVVSEELCTHTVVYAESNGEEIIGYGKSGESLVGQEIALFADEGEIHLFDSVTEKTILPEFSRKITVNAVKKGNVLEILGGECRLSDLQAESIDDGEIKVVLPYDAITEGNIPFKLVKSLEVEKNVVSMLEANGIRFYAKGDLRDASSFGIIGSKLELIGESRVPSIKESEIFTFTFSKRLEKEGKKPIEKHFCNIEGMEVESFYNFNKKMYRLGRDIFRKAFDMKISMDNLRLARDNEPYPCIKAMVRCVASFGDVQYSEVVIGTKSVFVRGGLPYDQEVTLAIDLDNVSVLVENTDTILF